MELRQLKYFLAVAQELHFGNAAKKLNISQPPLSMQIKQLEEELGFKLFDRSSRFVELTPQGEFLKHEIKSLLKKLNHTIETAKEIAQGKQGRLRIGFVAIVTQSVFPDLIREYKAKFPGVNLELMDLSSSRQLNKIRGKEIDIGFINSYGHQMDDLSKRVYLDGEFKIAIPSNHRLVCENRISLKDLKNENIIMFKREVQPILYDAVIDAFKNGGASPFTVQDINQRITSLALVAAGMGVCPVSDPVQRLRKADDVVYKKIEGRFPNFEIASVWSKTNNSPRLKAFIKLLEKHTLGIETKT